jgi:hypothetical protein
MIVWSRCESSLPRVVFWSTIVLSRYRQNELREGAQRATAKQYYYIDYEHFCNVVKWRIARMRKQIDTKGRNVRYLRIPDRTSL